MRIDVITYITKHKMDSGQKAGYYTNILSSKNNSLWSVSTGEQFASSFLTSARSDFTVTPRMQRVATGPNTHQSE